MIRIIKLGCPLCRLASLILLAVLPVHVLAEDRLPLSSIPLPSPEKRYPVKNDHSSIKEAYSNSAEWEGRAVSVDGTIRSIETNARGQPSIELAVGSVSDTTIWATWPLANTNGMDPFLRVGERLRVLGWMRDSVAWARVTHLDLPRQNSMTLLPICLVKVRSSDSVFDSKYVEYCEAWRKGIHAAKFGTVTDHMHNVPTLRTQSPMSRD
jgi:hypothetical protein